MEETVEVDVVNEACNGSCQNEIEKGIDNSTFIRDCTIENKEISKIVTDTENNFENVPNGNVVIEVTIEQVDAACKSHSTIGRGLAHPIIRSTPV